MTSANVVTGVADPLSRSTEPKDTAVFLNQLQVGQSARLLSADLLCEECDLIHALGMTDRCRLRVCKAGNPCIIQVHSTRIGLAEEVAGRILVIPEDISP
ncbi:MAG: ferrous iron transport protein A [Deltaproteobacteria bacterium]|nr:ferrous iron transport protein A [Deltaproteobacteria bacterium]